MSVNLTKRQYNRLMNGHSVRVRPIENGDHSLLLNKSEQAKLRRAMNHGKSITISKHHLEGAGFKSVMKKVGKSIQKQANQAIQMAKPHAKNFAKKELQPIAEDIWDNSIKPTLQEEGKRRIRRGRANLEEAVRTHTIKEKTAEKLLTNMGMSKDLAKDLITSSNIKLSNKASEALDRIQNQLEDKLDNMGMSKGIDYDIIEHNYPTAVEEAEVLGEYLPEDVEPITGSGMKRKHHRVVVLKGQGAKSFFKKIGRSIAKVVASKPVKNVLKNLASQGVSTLTTMATGSPVAGELVGNMTKGLTDQAVDAGTSELAGLGMRKAKMRGGALYVPGGGALYVPTGRGINLPVVGKLSQHDKRYYL